MSLGDNNKEVVSRVPAGKLDRLLKAYGVAAEFIEFSGNVAHTPLENRLNILSALGIDVANEEEVDRQLAEVETRDWVNWLEPVILAQPEETCFRMACASSEAGQSFEWRIKLEEGGTLQGTFKPEDLPEEQATRIGDEDYVSRLVPLPDLPLGYHRLTLCKSGQRARNEVRQCLLIVSPPRCAEASWLLSGQRIWGISVQLYSICSKQNWGIGDFEDLSELIELSAPQGADFVLLNPLHALDNRYPENASPYSPMDRRFLNPLYIHIEGLEDFRELEQAGDPCGRPDIQQVLEKTLQQEQKAKGRTQGSDREPAESQAQDLLRPAACVDYTRVFTLKYRMFQHLYDHFREQHLQQNSPRAQDFKRFKQERAEALQQFARFQAAVKIAGVASAIDPDFHIYLQWLAEDQLAHCQRLATDKGMKVGLIRDLAVGGGSDSAEVATNPDLFCMDARIGAPPDNFNPDGQNWGLPPLRPNVLRESGYAHFIELLRENMRPCGALRIDHVMALMRLWWCPTDGSNASGAYVHYPVDELFAILRLESYRADCMIIGEDLGVVPPEIRAYLDGSGVLSNVIFYFEKYDGWHFKKPEHYPHRALAIVANHDVPTLKAWWNRDDIELRFKLGLIGSEQQFRDDQAFRQEEKHQVLHWLNEEGLLPQAWADRNVERPFEMELATAIFRCCAASSSLLVSVQLDDIAGMEAPINIPGTADEYPNWRRKIPVPLKELFSRVETRQLLAGLEQERA